VLLLLLLLLLLPLLPLLLLLLVMVVVLLPLLLLLLLLLHFPISMTELEAIRAPFLVPLSLARGQRAKAKNEVASMPPAFRC
jgi:hypothetical protein